MKKLKRILGVICIVLVLSELLNGYAIGIQNPNKTVKAAVYQTIEIDGVTWGYNYIYINLYENPKYQNPDTEYKTKCARIWLENANDHTEITIPDTIEGCPVYQIESIKSGNGLGFDKVTTLKIPITVERIEDKAFWGWNALKEVKFYDKVNGGSTIKEIPEEKMYFYHIGDEAFGFCQSLVDIQIKKAIFSKEDENIGQGIYRGCTGLKKADISSIGEKANIPPNTFLNCNLEEGIQVSENIKELTIGNYAFRGCNIKNLKIPCDCFLGNKAFSENNELQYAEFNGDVSSIGEKILEGSSYGNNNTKVVFLGENIKLGKYALANSGINFLEFLNPNGTAYLGYRCIFESKVENIEFKNKNVIATEGGMENTNEKLSKIVFENTDTARISDGAFCSYVSFLENKSCYRHIKEIEFQCKEVVYENISGILTDYQKKNGKFEDKSIVYGNKVEKVSGVQGAFLSRFANVYIENPMMIHEATYTGNVPSIYGYAKHKELSPYFAVIQNRGLILSYEEPEIINNKGIDLDKLHVYTELKTGKQIEIPKGKIIGEEETPKPQEEEEYLVQYSENLSNYEGVMPVKIYYQFSSDELEIPVVSNKENRIQVEWFKDYADNLIQGQTIDLEQLVEKVNVYYNDGSCQEKDAKVLKLISKTANKGENTITVCLKDNEEIKDSLQYKGKENQVESVSASYSEKEVYLGDKIELDKIHLKAVYTLEDASKNTDLICKRVSKDTFDLEGKNIIRVYYTDKLYCDMEVQVKVAKPVKVEALYNENFPCYGVNEEIKKEAVEVCVTLDNKKVLTNSQLQQPFEVNIVSYSKNSIIATVTYDGMKSNQFSIPLTENKIISISPILCGDSVLEGTLIGKELISRLRIDYENGVSELVNLDDLDQSQLQVSEEYLATARQWNTITLTYMGIKGKADVWGEEDSTILLSVQYVGKEIEVGNSVSLEDCKVYLVKKSGKKVQVADGITIINPVVSNIGENVIYLCYGTFQGNIKVKGIKNTELTENLHTVAPIESPLEPSLENNNNKVVEEIKNTEPAENFQTIAPTEVPVEPVIENNNDKAVEEIKNTEPAENLQTVEPIESLIEPTIGNNNNKAVEEIKNTELIENLQTVELIESPVEPIIENKNDKVVEEIKNSEIAGNPPTLYSIKSNNNKIKENIKIGYNVQTKKAVKIILQMQNVKDIQYQLVIKGKKVSAKKWKTVKKNSVTIKNTAQKYGILYIRFTLPDGNIRIIHTTGFCIDTIAPTTNVKKNQIYQKGKKILFSDNCGVKWAKLDGKEIKSGTKIKSTGKHALVVMDKAGNKITIPFSIR